MAKPAEIAFRRAHKWPRSLRFNIFKDGTGIREFTFGLWVALESCVIFTAIRSNVMGQRIEAADQRTIRMHLAALRPEKHAAAILFLLQPSSTAINRRCRAKIA